MKIQFERESFEATERIIIVLSKLQKLDFIYGTLFVLPKFHPSSSLLCFKRWYHFSSQLLRTKIGNLFMFSLLLIHNTSVNPVSSTCKQCQIWPALSTCKPCQIWLVLTTVSAIHHHLLLRPSTAFLFSIFAYSTKQPEWPDCSSKPTNDFSLENNYE